MDDLPPFPAGVRLATSQDIPRLAVVATAGFYTSPQFHWERPSHKQHPHDTYLSYAFLFAYFLREPGFLVVLVEEDSKPDESKRVEATIEADEAYIHPEEGTKVPVGVAVLTIPKTSKWHHLHALSPANLSGPISLYADSGPKRDVHVDHRQQLRDKVIPAWKRHFSDNIQGMDMLVLHPAYQGKGHGKTLSRWGVQMADAGGLKWALVSQPPAVRLYESLGFEVVEAVTLEDGQESLVLRLMAKEPFISR